MKLTYDPRQNLAYLRFAELRTDVETLRFSDELNIDLAPNGRVCGIELLNANEQLGDKLIFRNEAAAKEQSIALKS